MSGNILIFRKLGKNKPKQPEIVPCFGFATMGIIWGGVVCFSKVADLPTIFTKINVPPQVFLCFMIRQMVPNLQNTPHICSFAFSGNFTIRFYGNEFSQDCSGHYSVKCHVWEKV